MPLSRHAQQYYVSGETASPVDDAESFDEVENIIEDSIFHDHDVFFEIFLSASIIWPKIVRYEAGKANHHCFPAEPSGLRRSNFVMLKGSTTLFDPTSSKRSFGIFTLAAAVTLSALSWAAPPEADNGLVSRADVITRRDVESVDIVARTELPNIPDILDGLIADLTPLVSEIS
ncbi:hypothetical protein ACEPAG_9124 [Sanghuangporus baumii]